MLPIRSQKDLSILCDFGSFLVFLHVRKKNRASPGLLSAFDTDFADPPSINEVINWETYNDRRYSQMKYLSNHFRIYYSIVVQF